MSCMWISVMDCSQSHLSHLAEMIREDRDLQIVLSYGEPKSFQREKDVISEQIEGLLLRLGMPSHLKGYQYLKTALEICMEDMEELDGVTKRLYPNVARRHKTTADKVEHAIRHAVEAAWKRGDERFQKRIWGYGSSEGKRPTNTEIIVRMVECLEGKHNKYFS